MMNEHLQSLSQISCKLRSRIIEHSHRTNTPHLGSCLSCVDILSVLYFSVLNIDVENPFEQKRDRFVLSKGHAAPALYQVLALRGFFSHSKLINSSHDGSDYFGEHPPAPGKIPGVEAATGSLGHGMSMAIGMLLSCKLRSVQNRGFVLVGDGECNEGSIWEAAMFASANNVNNLCVIIDFNKWQATDRSRDVMQLEPFADKWSSFGWDVAEVDGHDIPSLSQELHYEKRVLNKPKAIIAHTIKGKGVSFMEDDNNWHYRIPNAEEVCLAKKELGQLS